MPQHNIGWVELRLLHYFDRNYKTDSFILQLKLRFNCSSDNIDIATWNNEIWKYFTRILNNFIALPQSTVNSNNNKTWCNNLLTSCFGFMKWWWWHDLFHYNSEYWTKCLKNVLIVLFLVWLYRHFSQDTFYWIKLWPLSWNYVFFRTLFTKQNISKFIWLTADRQKVSLVFSDITSFFTENFKVCYRFTYYQPHDFLFLERSFEA